MTICIGALCANGDGTPNSVVVAASDRMVTLAGFVEFEHDVPKGMQISERIIGLMAGDALRGSQLQRNVRKTVPAGGISVAQVANEVARVYVAERQEEVENSIFRPRGLTSQEFYQGGVMQRLLQPVAGHLDQSVASFDYGVELLLVGVDDEGGHIMRVSNPGGSVSDYEQIGYHAIGSGTLHALQAMIGFRHTGQRGLAGTLFNVYVAKKRAEVAPGVGNETDMMIVSQDGVRKLDENDLKELEDLRREAERPLGDDLRAKLDMLNICKEVKC
jgi:20S proteasome alpha/beta subunit